MALNRLVSLGGIRLAGALIIAALCGCAEPRSTPLPSTTPPAPDAATSPAPDAATSPDARIPVGVPDARTTPLPPDPPDAAPLAPDLAPPAPDLNTPRCGASDGICPPGCPRADDVDCRDRAGSACSTNTDCATGLCADGICCLRACTVCQVCAAPDGACQPRPASQPDPRCSSGSVCDGRGACIGTNGAACGAPGQCLSGVCEDAVCCQRACGICETCGPDGTCTAITNAADPGTCEGADRICTAARTCGVIDQRQDTHVSATSGLTATNSNAQGITVGRTGQLIAIRVRADCDPGAVMTVSIRSMSTTGPTGPVLASASLAAEQMLTMLPPGEAGPATRYPRQLFVFSTPLAVTRGMEIALVMSAPDSCWVDFYGYFEMADPYPAGRRFYSLPAGSWMEQDGDACFETVMAP